MRYCILICFVCIFAYTQDIETIRKNLSSNDFVLKSQTLQQVIFMYEDAEPFLPELIKIVSKEKGQNKYLAIQALGNIGEKASLAFSSLQKNLDEDDFYSCYYSILALGQIKSLEAIPVLLKKMNDEDPNIRSAIIVALNTISPPNIISLFQKYSDDPDALVQKNIIASLQLRKLDNDVYDILIKNLKHSDLDVQFLATQLLEITAENANKVIPIYLELLHSKESSIVANVLGDFANAPKLSEVAIPEIIPFLMHKNYNQYASYALVKIGKASLPFFEKLLASKKDIERQQSVIMITKLGAVKSYASVFIKMAAEDTSSLVQAACLLSLAQIKEVSSADMEFLKESLSTNKLQTIRTIGVLQLENFIPQLTEFLKHDDAALRRDVYIALGNISFLRSDLEDILTVGLQQESSEIQQILIRYLAKIKSKKAVPELQKMLHKDHPSYVLAIINLGEIGLSAQEALPDLYRIFKEDKNYITKNYCMHSMVKMGTVSIPFFLEALDYNDDLVRTYSLTGLIQMEATDEVLAKLLEVSKRDIPHNLKKKVLRTYEYLLQKKKKS